MGSITLIPELLLLITYLLSLGCLCMWSYMTEYGHIRPYWPMGVEGTRGCELRPSLDGWCPNRLGRCTCRH